MERARAARARMRSARGACESAERTQRVRECGARAARARMRSARVRECGARAAARARMRSARGVCPACLHRSRDECTCPCGRARAGNALRWRRSPPSRKAKRTAHARRRSGDERHTPGKSRQGHDQEEGAVARARGPGPMRGGLPKIVDALASAVRLPCMSCLYSRCVCRCRVRPGVRRCALSSLLASPGAHDAFGADPRLTLRR